MPYNKLSNKFLNDLQGCFFKQAMSAVSPGDGFGGWQGAGREVGVSEHPFYVGFVRGWAQSFLQVFSMWEKLHPRCKTPMAHAEHQSSQETIAAFPISAIEDSSPWMRELNPCLKTCRNLCDLGV